MPSSSTDCTTRSCQQTERDRFRRAWHPSGGQLVASDVRGERGELHQFFLQRYKRYRSRYCEYSRSTYGTIFERRRRKSKQRRLSNIHITPICNAAKVHAPPSVIHGPWAVNKVQGKDASHGICHRLQAYRGGLRAHRRGSWLRCIVSWHRDSLFRHAYRPRKLRQRLVHASRTPC